MPDRYSDTDRSSDSRESRTGPIDSCDARVANPAFNWLMVAGTVILVVLAGAI